MNRLIATITVFSICLVSFGCLFKKNKESSNGPIGQVPTSVNPPAVVPQPNPQEQNPPVWKVSFHASCAEEEGDQCLGKYGLFIYGDGRYEVGPGPAGQLKKGKLKEEELLKITNSIEQSQALEALTLADGPEICKELADQNFNDSVKIGFKEIEKQLIHTQSAQLCSQGIAIENAILLHQTIHALGESYYPIPFANKCFDVIEELYSISQPLASCNADVDCAYVSGSFEIISPGVSQFVITDNCSVVKPMVVGNISSIINQEAKLQTAMDSVQETCPADQLLKNGCTGIIGFDSSVGSPVCQQNLCRINAAAISH